MHMHLVVTQSIKALSLPEEDMLMLGRSRATETRLVDPHVSRVHCRVEVSGADVVLIDNDSAGGTFVNGRRVQGPYTLLPATRSAWARPNWKCALSPDEVDTVPPQPGCGTGYAPRAAGRTGWADDLALPDRRGAGQRADRSRLPRSRHRG